jgi:hypothetical protein
MEVNGRKKTQSKVGEWVEKAQKNKWRLKIDMKEKIERNNDMSKVLVQNKCEQLVTCHNAHVTRDSVDIC